MRTAAADTAGIPKGQRYGWHSFRRKFASELKHLNQKDLMSLGGWQSPETLIPCYVVADQDTQRAALAQRKELRTAGVR